MGEGGRSQADLVRLAAARDADAFADLLDPLGLRLLLFIRRRAADLLGPDCAAEDLLQVVLARVWALLPTFEYRGSQPFYRWLVTITERAISDRLKYVRAKGRREVRHLESDSAWGDERAPVAMSTSVASRAARREARERLGEAIAGLDADQRAVVDRRLLAGESLAETASALGISKATAWERLQAALARLRVALEPEA
ncbi:MAG: sigma-70 family RNA polymerase sigma factor [Planctomycetales bacterium]|nr:sigma-70 family RNA polymerase sigma factor [Planctomycetales bacterium]